jgi:hypothetical protein
MRIGMAAALPLGRAGLAKPGTLMEHLWQMNSKPARTVSTTLG